MKTIKLFLALILALFIFNLLPAQTNNEVFCVGNKINIESEILQEKREIYIALPSDYNSENTYPVLYLLDAEWYFQQTATVINSLSDGGRILPMIVVGIPNTIRKKDFGHTPDSTIKNYKHGTERFIEFLDKELIPYIDKNYATNNYRILKGWCATGFFTINTLFEKPDLFNAYYAATPFVIKDDNYLLSFR
jgi:predicted alpha/beta superfamily hydrolase